MKYAFANIMIISQIISSTYRISAKKLFAYVFVVYLTAFVGTFFRTQWETVINMIQIGGYKINQSVSASHPLLCIFTSFKPATHKLPVTLY